MANFWFIYAAAFEVHDFSLRQLKKIHISALRRTRPMYYNSSSAATRPIKLN